MQQGNTLRKTWWMVDPSFPPNQNLLRDAAPLPGDQNSFERHPHPFNPAFLPYTSRVGVLLFLYSYL